ncbi:hypothetical protein DACRYDRAFT_25356 [Dacryopinax primogenitus]|uniref:F-box domain-containing protein n=1 Tax=Dacryopinax primogenitus (strain DJM 731) TaxID=1858805 RepID=M5FZH3_DACPD|nr:uncharacterized protein DACRYDRAFT_25356 [Dacryopinax primogenitus]EJT96902.1 hypothetical protein DACRYDRAFT_25356 [Dacryopinax primogenitus]
MSFPSSHGPRLPLELLLYHIVDILSLPPHPLSYLLPKDQQHALITLSLTCHRLHTYCMPLLYSRICIESAQRLRRLRRARPADLGKITALFLDFEHLEDEVLLPIPAQDADIVGNSYRTFAGFSSRAALYYEVSEQLSFLISACRPSLQRLAFGSRGRPHPPWVSMDPMEERAVEHFASQANYAIASTLPGLRELICVRQNMEIGDYLGLGRSGGQRRWEKLERLAVYGTLSYNAHDAPPILPALECFCALHPFPSLALLSQAVTTSPNLRELSLFNVAIPVSEQTPSVRSAYTDLDRILEALGTVGPAKATQLPVVSNAGAAGTRTLRSEADHEADTFTPPAPSPSASTDEKPETPHRKQPVHVTRLSLPPVYDPHRPEDRRERTSLAARLGREGLLWSWRGEESGAGFEGVGVGVGSEARVM